MSHLLKGPTVYTRTFCLQHTFTHSLFSGYDKQPWVWSAVSQGPDAGRAAWVSAGMWNCTVLLMPTSTRAFNRLISSNKALRKPLKQPSQNGQTKFKKGKQNAQTQTFHPVDLLLCTFSIRMAPLIINDVFNHPSHSPHFLKPAPPQMRQYVLITSVQDFSVCRQSNESLQSVN